jgi:hypothetical protein
MIITKALETTIDFINPNDIFSVNVDKFIMEQLTKRYANKCYQSILITSIKRIFKRSAIRIVDNRIDGAAQCDVSFEVEGIIYIEGEIIPNCKITEIRNKDILMEHEHIAIKLEKTTNINILNSLSVNDVLPIVAHKMRYLPSHKNISMIGSIFMPQPTNNIAYIIDAQLQPNEIEKLKYFMDIIYAEEVSHEQINKYELYDFFKKFLYPYKSHKYDDTAKKLNLTPVNLEFKTLSTLKTPTGKVILYPAEDDKFNRRLYISSGNDFPDAMSIKYTMFQILMHILTQYILYLQTLRQLTTCYCAEKGPNDMFKKLKFYWSICDSSKKSI